MIEAFRSSKVVDPGAFTPPTEPLKRVSPVNTSVWFTTKLSIPSVCPGVCSASMLRPPTSSTFGPGLDRAIHVEQPLGLKRVREDLDAELLLVDVVLGHVVGVVMGEQQMRGLQVHLLDLRQQRLGRPTGVDDHRGATGLVGHEVGV